MKFVWKSLIFSIIVCATLFVTFDANSTISKGWPSGKFDFFVNENVTTNGLFRANFEDNSFTYQFLKHPGYCDRSVELLIIVLSIEKNFEIRETIRQTWGSSNDSRVRVNFLFSGQPFMTNEDDVIMTNLPDTYENLILKVHSLLTYKSTFCSNANYVLKIDEDAIVDIPGILARLTATPQIADDNSLMCYVWKKAVPKRDPDSKWYTPRTFWPPKYFPTYCNGPMYLIGTHAVNKMISETTRQKFWKIEDVFWTGVVAQAQNIRHFEWNRFHSIDKYGNSKNSKKCWQNGLTLSVTWYEFKTSELIRSQFENLKNNTC